MKERDYFKLSDHILEISGSEGWTFCSCGARTGPLMTRTAVKRWHRNHRAEVSASIRYRERRDRSNERIVAKERKARKATA